MFRSIRIFGVIAAVALAIPAGALGMPANGTTKPIGTTGWSVTAVINPTQTQLFGSAVVQGPFKSWNVSQVELCVAFPAPEGGVHWFGIPDTLVTMPPQSGALWSSRTDLRTRGPTTAVSPGNLYRTWAYGYVMGKNHKWAAVAVVSPAFKQP